MTKYLNTYEDLKNNIGRKVNFEYNSGKRFYERLYGVLKINSDGKISADYFELTDPNNEIYNLVCNIELV